MSLTYTDEMIGLAHLLDRQEKELMRLRRLEAEFPGLIRSAYRRGYLAGRAAQRRGADAVDRPEEQARGWIKETCS